MISSLPTITERQRLAAPTVTPQALAWHAGKLWIGSRDLRRFYGIEPESWKVVEEYEAPGIPWAAVSTGEALRVTIGEGMEDDRYVRSFVPGKGFTDEVRFACPELTGSYLSYNEGQLYLSQWYLQRILQLDEAGKIVRMIDVGAEICGHTFVDGLIYMLRGTEQGEEDWRLARLDPREATPAVEDLARMGFACRSLAFDGAQFWCNHRAANETVAFTLPDTGR